MFKFDSFLPMIFMVDLKSNGKNICNEIYEVSSLYEDTSVIFTLVFSSLIDNNWIRIPSWRLSRKLRRPSTNNSIFIGTLLKKKAEKLIGKLLGKLFMDGLHCLTLIIHAHGYSFQIMKFNVRIIDVVSSVIRVWYSHHFLLSSKIIQGNAWTTSLFLVHYAVMVMTDELFSAIIGYIQNMVLLLAISDEVLIMLNEE